LYNPNISIPVYGFGSLIDPIYKTPAFHRGIDFAVPQGTPVFATADGRVTFSGQKRAKGIMVEIDHGNGYITQYAHLSKTKAGLYSNVKRGDLIGYVGNTGKSFIEHLHYEIQFEGTPINPVNYFFLDLSIEQYSQMLEEVMKAGISLD
jgi:murein DD-endopeptidase MepM/ murein hydrolase activator NlpD